MHVSAGSTTMPQPEVRGGRIGHRDVSFAFLFVDYPWGVIRRGRQAAFLVHLPRVDAQTSDPLRHVGLLNEGSSNGEKFETFFQRSCLMRRTGYDH